MLDAPERPRGTRNDRAESDKATRRGVVHPSYRRDLPEDFLDFERTPFDSDQNPARGRRNRPLRVRLARLVPRSWFGKAFLVLVILTSAMVVAFAVYEARIALLHDARFVIPNSEAVEIAGNSHMSRAQLLSVFGDDVDRNIWKVPLEERRATLEALPWVEHATVMRLLPNRLRVTVIERTPVAFVRDGSQIGLVDGSGVLLEFQSGQSAKDYSFPVVEGISASDPLSTRNARMKMFLRFLGEMDYGALKGQEPTQQLSEVDLSDPEDIKATHEDNGRSILIHFGDRDFLARWRHFTENLPDWEKEYPKLGSADLRYDHEVVLQMAGVSTAQKGSVADAKPPASPVATTAPKPTVAIAATSKSHGAKSGIPVKPPVKVQTKAKTAPAKTTPKKGAKP